MAKKKVDLIDVYFPTDPRDRLEYVLQRAKKVLAEKTQVVKVHDIRPGPEPTNVNEFPSIEVVVRILGIPFEHPFSHQPILPSAWIKNLFEREAAQKNFIELLCRYCAARSPVASDLKQIKRKLMNVSTGRPSRLPPRLDLLINYEELVGQVTAAKRWLKQWQQDHNVSVTRGKEEFFQVFFQAQFRWFNLVKDGQLDLGQIIDGTAGDTAKSILAKNYGVETDAIHSRLFRKE
jgi:hypothetical protein